MSERYDCTDPSGRAEGMAAAGAAVRRGQIVVLPTDTVYGVGCDAFDADAVAAVLAAKGRGRDMPPPVLLPTARTAHGLAANVPEYWILDLSGDQLAIEVHTGPTARGYRHIEILRDGDVLRPTRLPGIEILRATSDVMPSPFAACSRPTRQTAACRTGQ